MALQVPSGQSGPQAQMGFKALWELPVPKVLMDQQA
jgi:hypothetical protein